jgi:hypothetical protein
MGMQQWMNLKVSITEFHNITNFINSPNHLK